MEEYEKYGWSMCNKVFKKQLYLETLKQISSLNFKANMAEDFLFNFFITASYKNNILVINKNLYRYYINHESITKRINFQNINNNIENYNKIIKLIKNTTINNNAFYNKCLKILKKEKVLYYANNLKLIRFKNPYVFFMYIKYKLLKTFNKIIY